MPFFESEYHRLHYGVKGDRTRPPLLLLHGFLGSHRDFELILTTLARHFYCILPDLPGHGQTLTNTDGYTFAATAQTLLSLLKQLNVPETNLLGYSMGGRIALYLTCEFPEQFSAVVLESASPGLRSGVERTERVRWDSAIARKINKTPLPEFLTQWYRHPMFVSLQQHPERYTAMIHRRQSNRPTEVAKALQGLSTGQQPSLWEALSDIEQPLLLLVGACDHKFVELNQKMTAIAAPRDNITLTIIEDCGHNIHLEAPEKYVKAILYFLDPHL